MGYQPRAIPDFSKLKGARVYGMGTPPIPLARPRPDPEQNPPQESWAGVSLGVTVEQAAEALRLMGTALHVQPEPIGDSGDGIMPCGYDAL